MSVNNVNIVNTNNWYQKMNIYGTNSNIVGVTGTNPSVQMLIITSANDVNYCSQCYPLSKTNGFTLTFQVYVTGNTFNSVCAYFGVTDQTSSFDANGGLAGQTNAVSLMIRSNVFRLYTNYGSNTIAASSNTTIGLNAWQTVKITYTPSVTNTWVVNYNGTNIITYNDSSYTSFAGNQNNLWGLYGTTASAVNASFRAVDLSVKQSLSLSSLKNTYSFYPEECFINKLSTHSQKSAAAAFGLRLLRSDYVGPIINVRRGSDNVTLDFYADFEGNLGRNLYGQGTSLLTWLAGSIGYVTKWYDQTNNGRDVINVTNAQQPKIGAPLLDNMSSAGKSAARGIYALYRVNSTYTGATIKLRRSSDNAVSDFYADVYGNLGTSANATGTSFTSWIGSSTAYVDTWYDQSGSGNHATQSTTANQPVYNGILRLIDSGSGSNQWLNMPSGTVPTGTLNAPYSFVVKHGTSNNTNLGGFIGSGIGSNNQSNGFRNGGSNSVAYWNYWWFNDLGFGTTSELVTGNTAVVTYNGTVHKGYVNGRLANANNNHTGGTTAAGQQYLFREFSEYLNGQMYSVFIFGSALSDNDRFACTSNPTNIDIKYDGAQALLNTTNVPLTAGLDNYTYVCNYKPMTNGYSSIVEQGSNPLATNNRSGFIISNINGLAFAGQSNDALMHYIGLNVVRKTVVMCNHNLASGNIVVNDNGSIYSYTSASPSTLAVGASAFSIGRNADGTHGGGEYFTGYINEVIVFKNTLTTKESQLYFTPNAITRKNYRSQPRIHIKDISKDNGQIPSGAIVALDTQMLQNISPGDYVSNWGGVTGFNNPLLNNVIYTTQTTHYAPYVSISSASSQYFNAGTKTFNCTTNGGFTAIWYGAFAGSVTAWERVFDFGNGQSNDNINVIRASNTTNIEFTGFNGGTAVFTVTVSNAIVQNDFNVWTFRHNTSTRLTEILKNGIVLGSVTATQALTNKTLSNTYIGRSNWTADSYPNINTIGLYMYDKLLTDQQVASISNHLMSCNFSNMPNVLPEYNNKVVRYGSTLSQGHGRVGQSIRFNGNTGSYLDIQDIPNWPLTVCFWMYNSSTTSTSPAAICSQDLAGFGLNFDISSNGTVLTVSYSTNGSTWTNMTTTAVSLNVWYHLMVVLTPTTIAYYKNGALVQSVSAIVYNTNRLIIGKSGDNGRPLNGYISDIRVYDYALRAEEISEVSTQYAGGAGQEIMNYNTQANYLVNVRNWYSKLNINKTGSMTASTGYSDPDVYYVMMGGNANSSNTLFNSTRIQDYNSFVLSFLAYVDSATDHGFYFYCGATSSTTVPTGTAGTAANSSYYVYFSVTGTKGVYLFNDQGQQLAYSSTFNLLFTSGTYIPITIIYNRSVKNTWTVNVSGTDILTYDDPNNTNWVSNISSDFWGVGVRSTTSGMNFYIRRMELSYTPYVNSVNTITNAQNSVKFPPAAMTANSTTFTGTGILDGVYIASISNGAQPAYNAFDNNTNTFAGEIFRYNYSTGNYTGSVTTTVTNLKTGTSTSYLGEWCQIQIPNAVTLNSFSLMGRQDTSLFLRRTPSTFYIAGSNNGSTWELIHSAVGIRYTSAIQHFTCNGNNTNKYMYFRLIANVLGNTGETTNRDYIAIVAWDLYTQMNLINAAVITVPPYSMTADTTTFGGNSLYDGTYTLTSSNTHSHPEMGPRYTIFNDVYGSFGNVWSPGQFYNASSGAYTGSVSTTVSGVSQSGEWVQIQLPNPIVLYSFLLNFWWPNGNYWARSFLIAASNDAITWTNIYDNTNASFVYNTSQTFVVTGAPTTYRYFRLIVRTTSGIPDCNWWILDQWKLYTNVNNFNLMKFPPASLLADTPPTFLTVNAKNWYNTMTYNAILGGFTPVLSGSDPLKQLQLTNGSTGGIQTQCIINNQPVMNYNKFTFTFQLYCANVNNGDYIYLNFGSGGYQVTFKFELFSYQGIRLSTTSVTNAVSSATNWYNSTWNSIRVEYNRSATNTWTMFFNETQIIQYSDPNWVTAPGGTWGILAFNGDARFNSSIRQLEMTINDSGLAGNNVLSGNYTASASTVNNNRLDVIASQAFNTTNSNMWHSSDTSTIYSSGNYIGGVSTTVSGTNYSGEWLQLQTPNPISLFSFSIYPRQDGSLWTNRSPKNFVMAGSLDGSTWYLLHTATGVNDWTSADKYFVCNGPNGNPASKYSYFRLIIMATNGGNSVNIINLNLYTPISLNNSITPATPKGLLDGLTWKYYNGYSSDSVSYYTTNTYINIGRCLDTTNINTLTNGQYPVDSNDGYSVEIFGYFRATVSGTYTFSLNSDDGSYLWIGSNALVGYTTSNANIINGGVHGMTTVTYTITLLSGTYYPIRIQYAENVLGNDLQFRFTPPGGTQTSNGQGYFFSGTGLDSAFPQESAKIIKDLTNTNTDGVYYIIVNGNSTPIHCLMNDCYDGGGWMMLMKGTRGDTFQYGSNYWSTRNTLNASDTTRNNGDAKYNTYNYSTVKDVLAIWPDISPTSYTNQYSQNGGSIFVNDGWTWLLNNWNETTRVTPFTGFNTSRTPHQNTSTVLQPYGINNPFRYNGFGTWCSSQTGAYVHIFYTTTANVNVRWGFLFNNETNETTSCDTTCGIGMGGEVNMSSGDWSRSGTNWGTLGINRTARFELYGR